MQSKYYELPGPNAQRVLERQGKHLSPSITTPLPLVWESAADSIVTDVDGNEYIDFSSGVLVTNTGHCHPKVVAAIQEQAAKLINCYDSAHPLRSAFCERLAGLMPDDLKTVLLLSSGSEAIDAALKVARVVTGKSEIIAFDNAFHGRTYMAMSVGGMAGPKTGFGPMVPGILRAPFPDYFRAAEGETADETDARCLDTLDHVLRTQSTGDVAALITEPYQGGAGSFVPSRRFVQGLRAFCDRHGILMIFDEVQSSFGRTGHMFAFEHYGIVPDIVVLGKGIASGVPTAAVIARDAIMHKLVPNSLSSTYGGNPLSCAAGLATIDVIEEEGLVARAGAVGSHMLSRMNVMKDRHRKVGDVRGIGLALAMEFVKDEQTKEPDRQTASDYTLQLLSMGVAVMAPIGPYKNVIRIAPPLTIADELADQGLDAMEAALQRI